MLYPHRAGRAGTPCPIRQRHGRKAVGTLAETLPRTLEDGLVLRWSSADDTERIADLIGHVFRSGPDAPPNALDAAYVRLLMRGDHPLMTPQDFAVVEDTARGRIVACACLWRQTWSYGGVTLAARETFAPLGRPYT